MKLSNNYSITTTIVGSVSFSDPLVLTNVLYLTEFTFNLISISKLSYLLNCCLIFHHDSCQILEESSNRMIGWVKTSMDCINWYLPKKKSPLLQQLFCNNTKSHQQHFHAYYKSLALRIGPPFI